MQLSEGELAAIRFLAKNYKNCIVLLNVGGVIDLSELNAISGVNAVLLSGQLGNIGGHVVADVLAGKSVPSGKLVDTWAKKYSDYPSFVCAFSFHGKLFHFHIKRKQIFHLTCHGCFIQPGNRRYNGMAGAAANTDQILI